MGDTAVDKAAADKAADEAAGAAGEAADKAADEAAGSGPYKPEGAFSQADVDRIVEERLARERKRYAGFDDLKAKAERLDEVEAEVEQRIEAAAADARAEAERALRAEFAQERIADKIEVAASGRFADVEDARLRLAQRADEFAGEDGSVNTDAIKEALDALLESHPHLAAPVDPRVPSAKDAGIGVRGKASRDVAAGYDRLRAAYGGE